MERLQWRRTVCESEDMPALKVTNRLETTSWKSATFWVDDSGKMQKYLCGMTEVDASLTIVWGYSDLVETAEISGFAAEECACRWLCWDFPTG